MITVKSHGFKFSRPEANIVFDVSYFMNPWRDAAIRNEEDPKKQKELIMKYMNSQEGYSVFVDKIMNVLNYYILFQEKENIVVAFCCSAGEYRSPAIAMDIAERLKKINVNYKLEQGKNSKI